MEKAYYIYSNNTPLTTIQVRSAREATIYACGILQGWQTCGNRGKKSLTVTDDKGRLIFERISNY